MDNDHWIVCLTHAKRLHHCVWERINEMPPDVVHVASRLCDQCLSEGRGRVATTVSLRDSGHSRIDMCTR
jgi:hypothetical protein